MTMTASSIPSKFDVDDSTLARTGNVISIKALGVDTAQIKGDAITSAKILDTAITGTDILNNTITLGKVSFSYYDFSNMVSPISITPTQTGTGTQFADLANITDADTATLSMFTSETETTERFLTWDLTMPRNITEMYYRLGSGNSEITITLYVSTNGTDWTTVDTQAGTGDTGVITDATNRAGIQYIRVGCKDAGEGGAHAGYIYELRIR